MVLETQEGGALIQVGDREPVHARLALFVPYQPSVGDVVLVHGRHEELYVIGLLEGSPTWAWNAKGRLRIAARNGRLHLHGRDGVSVSGETIRIRAREELNLAATRTHEAFQRLERRVRGSYAVFAHELVDRSDAQWFVRAKRVAVKVNEAMFINSEVVRAG